MSETLDASKEAQQLLQDLSTAISDWRTKRSEEIDSEVRFLKSLDTGISTAASFALQDAADKVVEILTDLTAYSPDVADRT